MALDRNIFSIPNNERSIDSFKSRLIGGGARPNLFEVELNFPSGVGIFDEDIDNNMVYGSRTNVPLPSVPPSYATQVNNVVQTNRAAADIDDNFTMPKDYIEDIPY